jgi:hypothetical protein
MKGTWQTSDHRATGGVALVLVVIAAAVLGSGAAAAIDTALVMLLIAAGVAAVLTTAALIAYLIWRPRRDTVAAPSRRGIVPAPVVHQLAAPQRPAIPQHLHLHFDGADPAAVAEILRRHQAE